MDFDLNDLDLENIGEWSVMIKIIVVVLVCSLVLACGFFLDTSKQVNSLNKERNTEIDLRKDFEEKQYQASALSLYRKQVVEIKKTFGALLKELPAKAEVPELLEDISKTGAIAGLHFNLFKPQQEKELEFYSELPIVISVVGNYHQFGNFVSQLATLSRIVTLHDFKIAVEENDSKTAEKNREEILKMDMVAKTYRYTEFSNNPVKIDAPMGSTASKKGKKR